MKNLITVIVLSLVLLIGSVFAQKSKNTVTFSSAYSNLDKDCKPVKNDDGIDAVSSSCKGVGGYRILIGLGRASNFFSAQTPDKKDTIELTSTDIYFEYKDKKVEWRLVDGKPFAVILRVDYDDSSTTGSGDEKKTGERLVVKGLKGYEYVDFEVDAKTADADVKARQMADTAYVKKMKITINLKL